MSYSCLSDVCTSRERRSRAEGWERWDGPGGAGPTKRARQSGIQAGSWRDGAERRGSWGNEKGGREEEARRGRSKRRRGGNWRRRRRRKRCCKTERNGVKSLNVVLIENRPRGESSLTSPSTPGAKLDLQLDLWIRRAFGVQRVSIRAAAQCKEEN